MIKSISSTMFQKISFAFKGFLFSWHFSLSLSLSVHRKTVLFIKIYIYSLIYIVICSSSYTDTGFTVNGVHYEGSLLCVGNLILSWAPKKFSEMTPNRYLDLFFFCFNNLVEADSFVLYVDHNEFSLHISNNFIKTHLHILYTRFIIIIIIVISKSRRYKLK